ncbi:ATP-dependent DNA ligase [Halorubrum sp. Atlit-8R]|uniref:ATP-dependent DNA ligase n=1 Tax=unclassified Halorubrum TaxID=2642239 RepID=UPI000EF214EE|nr:MULTISPECIES: ATP-dependent DNA ligase [unclassified Halorubrum]RLM71117.1 ATP-dependent DNA ligase [Halorubrum sp. Atlit-9R]RLM71985.1 ATP-dependent DNA ligase [Halorubrum sp. Atlit-9R]RLM82730.1 ATP-dependent DNA ligase [Halorubrum sp. Atlit-8R]
MEFAALAERAERVAANDGDIETTLAVADLLADAGGAADDGSTDDLPVVVRFLLGRVFPAHDTRTLDVGPALCREAIARAAGQNVSAADVEDRLAERGEIGAVAAEYDLGGQRGLAAFGSGRDALTVAALDEELRDLAAASGEGSESRKRDALFGLFTRCSPSEAAFLARLVLGEMRLGVGEGTVRDAVAEAFLASPAPPEEDGATGAEPELAAPDDAVAAVERALQVTNDYGRVAVRARDEGVAGLREESLRVGRPVQAMLAQAGTATDAVDAFGEVAVETKFDGARVQVHYDSGGDDGAGGADAAAGGDGALGPRLYSRNMDDVTEALPEIVEYVAERVDVPVILDGEVVAVDDDGDPLPFQEVLRRFRRKHDVDRMREAVSLRLHAFDCLHADGDDLLDRPLRERHDRLRAVLPDAAADLTLADDPEAIAAAERAALDAGHEGVMLKNPDAAYTPGDRGRDWLKRKPDVETLDAVVVGAEWGEGRRAELFGTFLLAVRDDGGDASDAAERDVAGRDAAERDAADRDADAPVPAGYATVGKVATGITDEALADLTERLEPHVVDETGTTVAFDPELVVEVGYEEIQTSPTYSAGYALRFPRFVGVREDKEVDDADSLARVRRLAGDD